MNIKEIINSAIPVPDRYIIGFANMTGLLSEQYAGYNYAIVLARILDNQIIDSIASGPNRKYFDLYNNINNELSETISRISIILKENNIENMPIKPTVYDDEIEDDYYETLRIPFSHKMAATRAGMGWIGKTDLLVTESFGPRIRLTAILHKSKLTETGRPIESSKCDNCNICVKRCPAEAANGKLWDINIDRDQFYDAFKCRKKCRELSKENMNEDISLCGICISVCPKGKQL